MRRTLSFAILLTLLLFIWTGVCLGEKAGPDSRQSEPCQLEKVTVTARKKEEEVQKIPLSTTVVSGTLIEDANISDTNELTRMTPNVYFKKSTSENVIVMRGITSFDTSVYSPTAVYMDDLMLPLHYAHLIDLLDVERVEVLRGPQGSLYGGNSMAGVINVVSRQPDNTKRMKITGDIGSYTGVDNNPTQYGISASGAGPIIRDHLYLGLTGRLEKGDGFTTNLYANDDRAGAIDRKNARAILRWTPTSSFDVSLTGDILNNDDRIAVYRFDSGPYRTDQYSVRHDADDFQKERGYSQNLRAAYKWKTVKLLSITGFRDYRNENLQDYDCTADPASDWGATSSEYEDQFISQEFRLSSIRDDSPFTWLVGAYGFTEETDIKQDNDVTVQHAATGIDTTGGALFGEGTWTFYERMHATVGLRYDVRRTEGEKRDIGIDISDEIKDAEVLPKFSLGYDLTDTAYGYATVSKGYLAGGYNYGLATDKDSFAYDPEYTWNYEIGFKTDWLERRLQVNLALFYIQMTDKQVFEMSGGSYPTTRVDNAAKALSKGVELELKARPARGWDIFAGLGYVDAEYDDWTATEWNSTYTALTRNDYSGKTLPNVPEYTGSLGIQYRHASGLFARADVSAVGPLYADQNNYFEEDAYGLVDLQLGYETEKFDIVLWGKNVFDTGYHTIAYDWNGEKLVQDGEPAMVGVRATLRF